MFCNNLFSPLKDSFPKPQASIDKSQVNFFLNIEAYTSFKGQQSIVKNISTQYESWELPLDFYCGNIFSRSKGTVFQSKKAPKNVKIPHTYFDQHLLAHYYEEYYQEITLPKLKLLNINLPALYEASSELKQFFGRDNFLDLEDVLSSQQISLLDFSTLVKFLRPDKFFEFSNSLIKETFSEDLLKEKTLEETLLEPSNPLAILYNREIPKFHEAVQVLMQALKIKFAPISPNELNSQALETAIALKKSLFLSGDFPVEGMIQILQQISTNQVIIPFDLNHSKKTFLKLYNLYRVISFNPGQNHPFLC